MHLICFKNNQIPSHLIYLKIIPSHVMGVRDHGLSPTGIFWDFVEIPLSESEISEIPVTFQVPNTSSHWDSAALTLRSQLVWYR